MQTKVFAKTFSLWFLRDFRISISFLSTTLWKSCTFTLYPQDSLVKYLHNCTYIIRKNISSNQLFSEKLLSRNFYQKGCTFTVHSVEKGEILSHLKNISSNQLFSNLFSSKTVTFTKFLPKKCEWGFLQFPHCAVRRNEIVSLTKKIFRQINSLISFHKTVTFTKFLLKMREREFQ